MSAPSVSQSPVDNTPKRDVGSRLPWSAKLSILLIGSAALAAIVWVGLQYSAWAAIDRLHAKIEATDPHWKLDDLEAHRKAVADDKNSALLILHLQSALSANGPTEQKEKVFRLMKDAHVLDADQIAVLREWANDHRAALQGAKQLSAMPWGRFPLKIQVIPFMTTLNSQDARPVMRMLMYQIFLHLEDNDAKGAAETCHALLNASRSLGDEPFLISMLIRFGAGSAALHRCLERALAQVEFAEEDLASLQKALEEEIKMPHFKNALRGERAAMGQMIQNYRDGKITIDQVLSTLGAGSPLNHVIPPSVHLRSYERMISLFNESIAACDRPVPEQRKALAAVEAEIRKEAQNPFSLIRLIMPATQSCAEASWRMKAKGTCVVTALAAERYRRKHMRWPDSLQTLVDAKLLNAMPTDPFDGQPVRWKQLPDGFLIYSVSRDGIDDGGKLYVEHDFEPNTDTGVRLWDVSARRQPPVLRADPEMP